MEVSPVGLKGPRVILGYIWPSSIGLKIVLACGTGGLQKPHFGSTGDRAMLGIQLRALCKPEMWLSDRAHISLERGLGFDPWHCSKLTQKVTLIEENLGNAEKMMKRRQFVMSHYLEMSSGELITSWMAFPPFSYLIHDHHWERT